MAALTTTRSGNWSDAGVGTTPWAALTGSGAGGVPGDGDTITLTHVVAVDAATTVGHSPGASDATAAIRLNTGGSLVINAGITLTVRGDVLKGANNAASITMAAGSTFRFDASQAGTPSTAVYRFYSNDERTGLYFQCNGSSGNHCTITSVKTNSAASGRIVTGQNYEGQIVATYTDFSYLGSASASAWSFVLAASGTQFDLTDCTIDNCGVFGTGNNCVDGSIFKFARVKFTNSLDTSLSPPASLRVRFVAAKTSGTRSIDLCSLDKSLYCAGTYSLSVTNSCLANGCSADAESSTSSGSFSGNYVDNDSTNNVIPFQTIDGCYYAGRTNQSHGPLIPNHFATAAVTNTVFEIPECVNSTDNGDLIMTPNSGTQSLTISGNILLPIATGAQAGKAPGTLLSEVGSSNNPNLTIAAEHNTYTVEADGVSGAICGFRVSENSALHAGGVTSFKSNLAWASASSATLQWMFVDMAASPATDVLATANSVKNAYYNTSPASGTLAAAGYKGKWSSAPGTTDIASGDPQFVDPTRNIIAWAIANGQAGTLAAAKAYLAADPSRIALLYAWVRDGWKVQNPLLEDAGHDGETIGAMGYVAPASTGSIASALIAIGVI